MGIPCYAAPIVPRVRDGRDTSNYDKYDERDAPETPPEGSCDWDNVF